MPFANRRRDLIVSRVFITGSSDGLGLTAAVSINIANMIGTSRETVSRLIHDLMKQNLLLSEGKTIYLRKSALDQFRAEL